MTFLLVPQEHWAEDSPDPAEILSEGTIFLYREGDTEPRLTAKANQPKELPPGLWLWIAEAPGYISATSGSIRVTAGFDGPERRLFWPVVPACRVLLTKDEAWRRVIRLDVVSLGYHAVFPVHPAKRGKLWVPVGPTLAYSVGPQGLIGIRRVGNCRHREQLELAPPSPPAAEYQDFMLSVRLPLGPDIKKDPLAVILRAPKGRRGKVAAQPAGVLWYDRRATYFYLGLPAERTAELTIEHPALRSHQEVVEPLGGSARELPEVILRPRLDLSLLIDYRPKRPHKKQEVEVYHCGRERDLSFRNLSACRQLPENYPLQAGLREVQVKGLDTGLHVLQARIDGQVVSGLGSGVFPFLDAEANAPPELPTVHLWEMEIYGHLLLDGEPVAGELILQPADPEEPVQRFPTDDDLLYRMTYFGRSPTTADRFPGDEDRKPEELLGHYGWAGTLTACSAEASCALISSYARLRGEGRLDLELGADRELVLTVVEEGEGTPVQGARVFLHGPGKALDFDNGDISWREPPAADPVFVTTDAGGHARARNLPIGQQGFTIQKSGFEVYRGEFELQAEGLIERSIEVRRERDQEGVRLSFASGAPLAGAYLLVAREDGSKDRLCSRKTSADGWANFRPGCLDRSRVFVLHPDAQLVPLDGPAMAAATEVLVRPAPAKPLRLRVVDENGRRISGIPAELRFGSLTLGPNDLLAGLSATGTLLFYLTDETGELILRGVDPDAVEVPELALAVEGSDSVPLSAYRAGEVVQMTLAYD